MLLVAGSLILFVVFCRKFKSIKRTRNHLVYLIIGLAVFYISLFPYYVIKTLPQLGDWYSRHLMLTPLGISLVIVFGLRFVQETIGLNKYIIMIFLAVIISSFTGYNLKMDIDYYKDWYKQLSIMGNMQRNEVIQNHRTFLVEDHTSYLNANNRYLRFYEYAGMMKKIFGNQKRFAINTDDYQKMGGTMAPFKKFRNDIYNLSDFDLHDPEYIITLDKGKYDLDTGNFLVMLLSEFTNDREFRNKALNIVTLTTRKENGDSQIRQPK